MSGAHIVENTNISNTTASTPPHNNEESLNNDLKDLTDRFKKLEDKLEDLEPLIKISRCIDSFIKKFSNDTQENSKDPQKKEEALEGVKEEINKLKEANTDLTDKITELQKQVNALKNSQQVLENEKAELKTEKENLTKANTDLIDKNKALTTEKDKLKQKYAPYEKLEKLYEVFSGVKGCLNFGFVEKTHSAMDLIASVLSDSKYYLESLYNKASQELSDKRSDKGEKLAELFDLLFEYVKDNKFERLKEPIAYDSTCKRLYPEQNTSGKMQRVVLIGCTYDKKTTYCTIVDMGL